MEDEWIDELVVAVPGRGGRSPLITYILTALCVAIFALQNVPSTVDLGGLAWLATFGRSSSSAIWNGQYSSLVTCAFAHGSLMHIAFNMIWLVQLGSMLELTLTPSAYFLLVVGSAAVGSGIELLIDGQTGIGFSGVVYGLFGFAWAGRNRFAHWWQVANESNVRLMVGWFFFCIATTYMHWMNVANGAHAGGFLFGMGVGSILFTYRRAVWSVVLAGLIGATVMASCWMPWSPAWDTWKAGKQFDRGDMMGAIHWYETAKSFDQRAPYSGYDVPYYWYAIGVCWHDIGVERDKAGDHAGAQAAYKEEAAALTAGGPEAMKYTQHGNGQ